MARSPIEEWKGKNILDKGGVKYKDLIEEIAVGRLLGTELIDLINWISSMKKGVDFLKWP